MHADGDLSLLLTAAARGDRASFRAVYEQTAPRLTGIAVRMLKRRDLAQDAVQDAYLKIWRACGQFDPARGDALAWMATILRRCALDRMAREPEHDDVDALEIADAPAPETEPRVAECLAALPDTYRRAVVLTYFDGLSNSQVAQRMSAPLGTVKAWVRRGVSSLRTCLGGAMA